MLYGNIYVFVYIFLFLLSHSLLYRFNVQNRLNSDQQKSQTKDSSIIEQIEMAKKQEETTDALKHFFHNIRLLSLKDLTCFVSNMDLIKRYFFFKP